MIAMAQGTAEWHKQRRGKPTASRFNDIVTFNTRLKTPVWQRSTGVGYLYELVADEFSTDPKFGGNRHTERGHELEPKAASLYALRNDVAVQESGFILSECGLFGGSPDRLVSDDGGLEIKCPDAKKHVEYLVDGVVPKIYKPQVYGILRITGRKWWDFFSYHPNMRPLQVRATTDDDDYKAWLEVFDPAIVEFCKRIEELRDMVRVGGDDE